MIFHWLPKTEQDLRGHFLGCLVAELIRWLLVVGVPLMMAAAGAAIAH
jgi:hypothetical protein